MARDFRTPANFHSLIQLAGSNGSRGQQIISRGTSPPEWGSNQIPSTTVATVVNTITETAILTYALPETPAVHTLFQFAILGTFLNNTGSNRNVTIRFKLGNTTLFDSGASTNLGSDTPRRPFRIEGTLGISGASAQVLNCKGLFRDSNAWAIGAQFLGAGTSSESLATSKNLVVTAQLSDNRTTFSLDTSIVNTTMVVP